MRLPLFLSATLILAAMPAGAQMRLDLSIPANKGVARAFEELLQGKEVRGSQALGCEIKPVSPNLGFDLRLWAGYVFNIPLAEFKGMQRSRLSAVIKLEPLEPGGEAVYLGRRLGIPRIPDEPPKRLYVNAGGGFALGAGKYRASLVVADARGRACMKSWTIKAKEPRDGSSRLARGVISDATAGWKGFSGPAADAAVRRVTVVMNAYPVTRRRHLAALSWRDQSTLMNVLGSLLSHGGYHSARVMAFDLANRRVLYDEPEFGPRSFEALADALGSVNLGVVDYETLARGPTERQFLESLVKDISKRGYEGEIVFITPGTQSADRASELDEGVWEGLKRPSVLALLPRPVAEGPVIDIAKGGKGRIFSIYSPSDLASVVERMAAGRQ